MIRPPGDAPPSPDEQARERRRRTTLDEATQELAAARRQLDHAVEHAQSTGRWHAQRIDDAIHDDVQDSWWDNMKDWVHRNAGWIKAVADILSVVATGLAFVALLIPGVNIIAGLAIGLTFLAAIGHTTLTASGDGSWAEVALDIFALATFGVGLRIAARLQGVQQATREAGARVAGQTARSSALASSTTRRLVNAHRLTAG